MALIFIPGMVFIDHTEPSQAVARKALAEIPRHYFAEVGAAKMFINLYGLYELYREKNKLQTVLFPASPCI